MGELDGKTAVITGASRGLGEAMAMGFAAEGASLVLAARTEEDLRRVAQSCQDAGSPRVENIPTDITDEGAVRNLVEASLAALGKIDVFVANAGTSYSNLTDKRYREVTSYDLDIVDQIFKVNLIGTWLCVKHGLEAMEDGSFITIGSEAGRVLYPGAGIYAISKAAIDALTTLASKEMAAKGVRVNCLSPGGMVDTHLFGPNKMPDFLKEHGYLEPDVIVPAAVWLASDRSAEVTGAFISAKEFNEQPVEQTMASLRKSSQPQTH